MDNKLLEQNILDLIGLESLSPEKRVEIMEGASQVIFQAIVLRLAEVLSSDDMAKLGELFESAGNDETKLVGFLKEKVPNFDDIVKEEIIKFKQETVDLLA